MKTYLDCIPCFVNQGLTAARFVSDDPYIQEQVVRAVLEMAATMDLADTPPAMGQKIHRIIRESSGNADPYREIKEGSNRIMLERLPEFRRFIQQSGDPFLAALRVAIAGNIIDYGAASLLDERQIHKAIDEASLAPINHEELERFRHAVKHARSILYIADNAGEIILDRLLIEQLPIHKVTLAVRGMPIINDATYEDARTAGLSHMVKVVENGSDAPGTILGDCAPRFRRLFHEADLIVAKGQGNYETLSDEEGNIFFLLKAKCPVITRHLGCERGAFILRKNTRPKPV